MTAIDTTITHAHQYAARGWRVIPILPGQKHPGVPSWQTAATTDNDLIDQWWTVNPGHGIGIATGRASGIWVLDVDNGDDKRGDDTLNDLEAANGELPATPTVHTGSGGRHLYFAVPEGRDIRNHQSGRMGPGLDVRGEGGQVLAPPTIHPNGRPYEWDVEAGPDLPPAMAPDWLLDLVDPPAPPPTAVAPTAPSGTNGTGQRPGDRWANTVTWNQLLTGDGWTPHSQATDGEQMWTRPGKDRREGASATVGYKGLDILHVFTSSVPELQAEQSYSKFAYLAATRHGGDYASAAAWCNEQVPDTSLDDWLSTSRPPTPVPPPTDWPTPQPLPNVEASSVPYPLDTLPDWIADHAQQVADIHQVPADLPATIALGALSTMLSSKVRVTLGGGSGWREHVNIYLVVAMPPGAGKSPVYRAMMRPLTQLETRLQEQAAKGLREAETKRTLLAKKIKKAEDAAGNAEDGDDLFAAVRRIADLKDQLAEIPEPVLPRLFADDATPEALVQMLGHHNGRMAILSTEGNLFDLIAGQYNDGRTSSLDVYLKGHSGDTIKRDRTSRGQDKGDQIHIAEALLTICVTTQPMVLDRLAASDDLARRGLPARFMFSVPPSLVGYRDRTKVYAALDATTTDTYTANMAAIGEKWQGMERPADLDVGAEATTIFATWDDELERRQRAGGDLFEMAEWATKLRASVLRLCGLLHIAHGEPHTAPIGPETMTDALAVADYWIAHATSVHTAWGASGTVGKSRRVLAWLADQDADTLRPRDIQRGMRGTFKTADDLEEPLEMLIGLGWMVSDGLPLSPGRGRPSATLTIHPELAFVFKGYEDDRRAACSRGSHSCRYKGGVSSSSSSSNTDTPPSPPTPVPPATTATTATTAQPPEPWVNPLIAPLDDDGGAS